MTLDDDERVGRGRAGGALGALAPAPAPSAHDVVAVHEDDLARVGEDAAGRSQVGEELGAMPRSTADPLSPWPSTFGRRLAARPDSRRAAPTSWVRWPARSRE